MKLSLWLMARCYCLLSVVMMADVVSGFAMTKRSSSTSSSTMSLQQRPYSSTTTTTSRLHVTTTETALQQRRRQQVRIQQQHDDEGGEVQVPGLVTTTVRSTKNEKEQSLIKEITSIPNFVSFLNQDEDDDADGGSLCIVK